MGTCHSVHKLYDESKIKDSHNRYDLVGGGITDGCHNDNKNVLLDDIVFVPQVEDSEFYNKTVDNMRKQMIRYHCMGKWTHCVSPRTGKVERGLSFYRGNTERSLIPLLYKYIMMKYSVTKYIIRENNLDNLESYSIILDECEYYGLMTKMMRR